ncbi:MAG TPA: serine hydrolase [Pyrinomonadaceae bacterium]|nr:serine hydrolase [Pyrinomonadaceae bacterium]
MKKFYSFILTTFLVGQMFLPLPAVKLVPNVQAQTAPTKSDSRYAEKIRKIEEFVQKQMKADGTVGLSVGFIKDDFIWTKGFGFADLENKVPAKAESAYRLASVTKPMTAVAVLHLAEQGKIDLDAEVQKYVSYFPKKNFPVTVRQILGHLGGISHYRNYDLEGHFKDYKNTRQSIAVFEEFDLIAEPGTRYSYSSYGYNLLGAVIEGASGKSYGEYMTENVWKPLGMNDTRLDNPLDVIPNRARGYQLVNGKIKNSEYVDISSRFAGGGTRSTVLDLLKFARGLNEGKILSDETRDKMWTSMATKQGQFTGYGMGWGTNTSNGRFIVSHGGSQAEAKTYLITLPTHNFAVAVASNFEGTDPFVYARKLYEIILGEPWNIGVFAKTQKESAILGGMDSAFDYGMQYFDRYGKPLTSDASELGEAFAYFNESLTSPEAEQRFSRGRHPAAKQAFVKIASYMASKLDKTEFNNYYQNGAIRFFSDYVNWYQKQANYPAELKFSKDFEQQISSWNNDWAKTWNGYTRNLEINESSDLKAINERLSKTFSGAGVYPNYVGDFEKLVGNFAVKGDFKKALEVGQTAVSLYPESDNANANLGIIFAASGEKEKAAAQFKKANEINPRGAASAGNLNQIAYSLGSAGQPEAGLRLLQTAVELYPTAANLYDSIGDFHRRMGNKEKAIEFYTKALEVDPNYPNAAAARETLSKLKQEK